MNERCRVSGCKVEHLHPVTGEAPRGHCQVPGGGWVPMWHKRKKPKIAVNLLTIAQTAKILNVCIRTVHRMLIDKKLEVVVVNRHRMIPYRSIVEVLKIHE